ncbi:hypothetical protein I3260_05250 [Photobacterium damselae]|uniref:hypothetical protein n=1 Tax=Photobacterium damselae TaxID=38293 RepID=UPI001EDF7B0C|nr:hypothetical protein [Photobacterium damselae]MCG3811639.1 hypothetical protein [Photobacterium damselae]
MKKLVTFTVLFLFSMSAWSYTIAGQDAELPDNAVKYCATASNYWVCIDSYLARS